MRSKTFPKFPLSWAKRPNADQLMAAYVGRAWSTIEAENLLISRQEVRTIHNRALLHLRRGDQWWAEGFLNELAWRVNFERTQKRVKGSYYYYHSEFDIKYWE